MQRKNIESSFIASIGYDSTASVLEIEFNAGQVWQYYDFPESLWYAFESAGSQGKFFHAEIKGKFNEGQVG